MQLKVIFSARNTTFIEYISSYLTFFYCFFIRNEVRKVIFLLYYILFFVWMPVVAFSLYFFVYRMSDKIRYADAVTLSYFIIYILFCFAAITAVILICLFFIFFLSSVTAIFSCCSWYMVIKYLFDHIFLLYTLHNYTIFYT